MSYILLVEDNELNQTVIEDVFEFDEVPAKLICASSGEEALEQAKKHLPKLILMDVQLPGMDGLETTRRLKSSEETKDIPVWALTAHAMKGDETRAIEAGCMTYITKPIDIKNFANQVREFLNEISSEREEPCQLS